MERKSFGKAPQEWEKPVVAPAPKLSKAKAAAAAKAFAKENPNRARIEAKIAEMKAGLEAKYKKQ